MGTEYAALVREISSNFEINSLVWHYCEFCFYLPRMFDGLFFDKQCSGSLDTIRDHHVFKSCDCNHIPDLPKLEMLHTLAS